MDAERVTFDTNVLYYALDIDGGEKHLVAADLLRAAVRADSVLLLQALAELYNAARKRKAIPLDLVQAFIADSLDVSAVIAFQAEDLLPAISLQQSHQLQFWDALLMTTALRAGCSVLFSEDGQHFRKFNDLIVLNPFLLSEAELSRLLQPL